MPWSVVLLSSEACFFLILSGLLNIEEVLVLILITFLSECSLSGFFIVALASVLYLYYFLVIILTF